MLKITNLKVEADNKIILDNLSLDIEEGSIHAIMGPNGMGKSTICKVLLSHPHYKILKGSIIYNDEDITKYDVEQKAKKGFFLLNQSPISVAGVSNAELLRTALSDRSGVPVDILSFHKDLKSTCQRLDIPTEFIHRDVNYGMSGGERKKNELLHMWMLKPKVIILDEVDSGLDVDAFKAVMNSINEYYQEYKPTIIMITHNTKVFDYINPNKISILSNGKIIKNGDIKLAKMIEQNGFEAFKVSENENHE